MKISIRQILASTAGAVVCSHIASFFGVSGTIVGVAIGSAAATIGPRWWPNPSTGPITRSAKRCAVTKRQPVAAPRCTDATGAVAESAPSVDVAVNAAPTVKPSGPTPRCHGADRGPLHRGDIDRPVAATSEESLPETTVPR